MYILLIYIIFQLIRVHYSLFNNPELLSSYLFIDKYRSLRNTSFEPIEKVCPGFNCKMSGLSHMQIDALIGRENQIRDLYASQKKISNLYSVHWDDLLALLAQDRVQLCCILPPTRNTVIYERVSNDWLNHSLMKSFSKSLAIDYPTAVEVVIASRSVPKFSDPPLRHSITDYIEAFNKIEYGSNPLDRRGGTVEMGCSYLIAANKTHDFDYMVCLYGYLYFDPNTTKNMYVNVNGIPCSGCTFYKVFQEIPETFGQRWSCGDRFPHTCSNLEKRSLTPKVGNKFDCNIKANTRMLKNSFFPSWYGMEELDKKKAMAYSSNSSSSGKLYHIPFHGSYLLLVSVTSCFTFGNIYFVLINYD